MRPSLSSIALAVSVPLALASACSTPSSTKEAPPPSDTTAPAATAPAGPPPGIGRRDNATVLGPFGEGPLTLRAHQSAEYSATVNSWLLETATEVAVVDAQLVMPEGRAVAALVRSTGKKLAWIFISHGHPDHYAGLEALVAEFPDTPVYAREATVPDAPALLKKFDAPLQKFFPGEMTAHPVPLTPYREPTLTVGGVEVRIVDLTGGEHPTSSMLILPTLRGAIIGDLVYNRVHPWLNEMDDAGVLGHIDMLEGLAGVDTFYPGHGEPFGREFLPVYRAYVTTFLDEVPKAKDANDLVTRMWQRYPDWRTMAGLRFSAGAYIGARTDAP